MRERFYCGFFGAEGELLSSGMFLRVGASLPNIRAGNFECTEFNLMLSILFDVLGFFWHFTLVILLGNLDALS